MSLGAAFWATVFFPHAVGKVGNALVTAGNHIVRKCHGHHHRAKIKQMEPYATKWCNAQ
jgi:hypothetical protein